MDRLNVINMSLEITRDCNLECRHCFRGEKQCQYMDLGIIDYVFDNVCRINEFMLTGGEPFLAKEQLKRITKRIMEDETNIGNMIIVTNGSVMSSDVLRMLYQINKRANLEIRLSNDYFHNLELEKKNLTTIKDNNIDILKEHFNVTTTEHKLFVIDKVGRAADITEEEMIDINSKSNVKYIIDTYRILEEYRREYPLPKLIEDDVVCGSLNIDVFGNIIPTYYSYELEDKNSYANICNHKTLKMAINSIDPSMV
ncbi:MAG: 4Fe-4S cluster-binding domain-containing protein [Bacilli bacterium]|nr:4Fe-4S cluster-binding domain-containing protein [Bacilli bacterium]